MNSGFACSPKALLFCSTGTDLPPKSWHANWTHGFMSYAIFVGSVQSLIPPDGPVASARPPLRFSVLVMAHVPPVSHLISGVSTSAFSLMNPSMLGLFLPLLLVIHLKKDIYTLPNQVHEGLTKG